MDSSLLVAGWKSVSLVDVHGSPSFTLWLCGCNLKCPFCHNWKIADKDPLLCRPVKVECIVEEVDASRWLVDYLHVTGGEPLLQHVNLALLFEYVKGTGVKCSLNSNLTLPTQLLDLVKKDLVDHVATDLKVPPEILYGVPQAASRLWNEFVKSLEIVASFGIPLELRIPVHKGLVPRILKKYIEQVLDKIPVARTVIIVNQLLNEPLVKPRDPSWCKENCTISNEILEDIVALLRSCGFSRIYVRSIPGF